MLHGRKKQAKQELTSEQKKEIEDKLKKITTINKTLLKKRANKDYDRASLEQTEKFSFYQLLYAYTPNLYYPANSSMKQTSKQNNISFLSPDFQTLWNYRREIIEHLFATEQVEPTPENFQAKYEFVFKELEFLVKSIMRSPKSYTLWFHRQWIIEKGLKFEKDMLQAKLLAQKIEKQNQAQDARIIVIQILNFYRIISVTQFIILQITAFNNKHQDAEENKQDSNIVEEKPVSIDLQQATQMSKSKILEYELKLCDKMLGMDERNFHCWNYRLLTTLLYLKEIDERLGQVVDSNIKIQVRNQFLRQECEMAEALIKKNFSNFSAWHYRSKLMPILYSNERDKENYLIPFEKIKEDLALLKHAFFTDPKDQSPWNYHEWLISLIGN